MIRQIAVAVLAGTATLGVTACGGSSHSTSGTTTAAPSATTGSPPTASSASHGHPAGGPLTLAANPSGQLKFTKSSLRAKAGRVSISFSNQSPLSHNLTIQKGTNGPIVGATPTFQGGTKTLTLNLKPGTYTFFCSVPGHRMAGMQGTLTVS